MWRQFRTKRRRLIAFLEEKKIILINKFAKTKKEIILIKKFAMTKDTKKKITNNDNLILALETLNRFQF